MSYTHFSESQAWDLIHQAIADKGKDYRDPNGANATGCVYRNNDGTPGCIVGHVFYYLGMLDEVVDQAPDVDEAPEGTDCNGAIVTQIPGLSGPGLRVLAQVQHYQDCGLTWGEAREKAWQNDVPATGG